MPVAADVVGGAQHDPKGSPGDGDGLVGPTRPERGELGRPVVGAEPQLRRNSGAHEAPGEVTGRHGRASGPNPQ